MTELLLEVYESAAPATQSRMLAQLVGKVYQIAPPAVRSRLLQQLLRPLGVLALVSVAGGVFAKLRLHGEGQDLQAQMDAAQGVKVSDLVALVDYVQQVSVETLDGLSQVLTASPLMSFSAAAAVLVTVLMRRARSRSQGGDKLADHPAATG
jgi:hypothetical protein